MPLKILIIGSHFFFRSSVFFRLKTLTRNQRYVFPRRQLKHFKKSVITIFSYRSVYASKIGKERCLRTFLPCDVVFDQLSSLRTVFFLRVFFGFFLSLCNCDSPEAVTSYHAPESTGHRRSISRFSDVCKKNLRKSATAAAVTITACSRTFSPRFSPAQTPRDLLVRRILTAEDFPVCVCVQYGERVRRHPRREISYRFVDRILRGGPAVRCVYTPPIYVNTPRRGKYIPRVLIIRRLIFYDDTARAALPERDPLRDCYYAVLQWCASGPSVALLLLSCPRRRTRNDPVRTANI